MKHNDYKIFILSENIQYRNILSSKLRIEGYNVEYATGGFHFIHLLERYRHDIHMLICHENMNDMPAEEIIALTRLAKNKADLPILFISKDNDEEVVCEMILKGANEFILQSENMLPAVERVRKYFSLINGHKAA